MALLFLGCLFILGPRPFQVFVMLTTASRTPRITVYLVRKEKEESPAAGALRDAHSGLPCAVVWQAIPS